MTGAASILPRSSSATAERRSRLATRLRALESDKQDEILDFLRSLVLFPPDDTASNLDPGDRSAEHYPQFRHGSIKLTDLFNDPTDKE